jgi:hypothetical protein
MTPRAKVTHMNAGTLAKVTARTAREVCAHFALGDEAKKLLGDGMGVGPFLEKLVAEKQHPDAVRLLAHALPKREAVWWALQCAREAAGSEPPPNVAAALAATDAWVNSPTEENRRATQLAYEAAELGTPAGCAALAAFMSGGSMAPPNVPTVPPGEFITAHAASGAVMLAAVIKEPEKAPEKYERFLAKGVEAANKQDLFKAGVTSAAPVQNTTSSATPGPKPAPQNPFAHTAEKPAGPKKMTLGGVTYGDAGSKSG